METAELLLQWNALLTTVLGFLLFSLCQNVVIGAHVLVSQHQVKGQQIKKKPLQDSGCAYCQHPDNAQPIHADVAVIAQQLQRLDERPVNKALSKEVKADSQMCADQEQSAA